MFGRSAAVLACSKGFLEEFYTYVADTRKRLQSLTPGSKLYWKLSKRLLMRPESVSSISALKDGSGVWVRDSAGKANLLGNSFTAKWILPAAEVNEYSMSDSTFFNEHSNFLLLRYRTVHKIISNLREGSATGPDMVSCKV